MRILFVTSLSYPPQSAGGSKSSTHELCKILKGKGHEVAVICTIESKGLFGIKNRIKRKVFPSIQFPIDHTLGYPVFRGWDPVEGITEVVRRFKPDIGIAQAGKSVSIAKGLLAANLPTVLYLRDVEYEKMGDRLFENPLLVYIANSKFTAISASNQFNVKAHIIPPLVVPERYITRTFRKNVLHVNPHPLKGIDITLELAKRRPDIPFDIIESWSVGKDLLKHYKTMADKLPNVSWHKRIQDMRQIYCRARVVLAPSQCEEAWGRIATEAHVSGIPVIASDLGGFPESVGPGGLLVPFDASIEKWEETLSKLWDDHKVYDRFTEASKNFSQRTDIQPEFLINQFIEILNVHISKK
jgi:glycosyltransferase involved in cell wall biosynthesis